MSDLKSIPVVQEPGRARSGEKYLTPQGFTAIRDGVKAHGSVDPGAARGAAPKPPWLRAKAPTGAGFNAVRDIVREHRLATVCEEAKCPNIGECWNAGTATIMLMGAVCTRACRFCSVDTGNPRGWLDAEEPANAARTVELMKLKYVVLTSVNRDDLRRRRRGALCRLRARHQRTQSRHGGRGADAGLPGRAARCRDRASIRVCRCLRRTSRPCAG